MQGVLLKKHKLIPYPNPKTRRNISLFSTGCALNSPTLIPREEPPTRSNLCVMLGKLFQHIFYDKPSDYLGVHVVYDPTVLYELDGGPLLSSSGLLKGMVKTVIKIGLN